MYIKNLETGSTQIYQNNKFEDPLKCTQMTNLCQKPRDRIQSNVLKLQFCIKNHSKTSDANIYHCGKSLVGGKTHPTLCGGRTIDPGVPILRLSTIIYDPGVPILRLSTIIYDPACQFYVIGFHKTISQVFNKATLNPGFVEISARSHRICH